MCISNNAYPNARVDFLDTILYGAEVQDPATGAVQHVLGYFNKVKVSGNTGLSDSRGAYATRAPESDDDFGWDVAQPSQSSGNAMIFAVPAKRGTLTAESLIPISKYPRLFEDFKLAVAPRETSRGALLGKGIAFSSPMAASVEVVKGFDGGLFDVLISTSPEAIIKALGEVDEAKRPTVNAELYQELEIASEGFTFVLFCFDEKDSDKTGGAMMKYTPMPGYEHLLYLPGLDGHNGRIERGEVELNHTLVVGSYRMAADAPAREVDFRHGDLRSEHDRPYELLGRVIGKVIKKGTKAPQGDFLFNLKQVRAGKFKALRQAPPGFAKLEGAQIPATKHFIE